MSPTPSARPTGSTLKIWVYDNPASHFEAGDLKRRADRISDLIEGRLFPELEPESLVEARMAQHAVEIGST